METASLQSDVTHLQLRQTAEQVKYSSGKKEYKVILSSASSPQKRSLKAWGNRKAHKKSKL